MASHDQFCPKDTPFGKVDCKEAFDGLLPREKRYAHYLSRAAWDGQFINFLQVSPESPLIAIFLDKVLRSSPTISEIKTHLKEDLAFSDDDVTAFFIYIGAFFSNCGNYRDYGDTKFVPELPQEKMESLFKDIFQTDSDFYIEHCLKPMYNYETPVRALGFPPEGITTYWSANCNQNDVEVVASYLKEKNLDAYNQRVFKKVENNQTSYEIRLASQQLSDEPDTTSEKLLNIDEVRNGVKFCVRRGDYSSLIPSIIKSLKLASEEAANDNEKQMLENYIEYFETGSLAAHKQGSRFWIKNKGPTVETYIGFIENYRDPAGARANYEGFVAVVNKEGSKKLGVLVDKAEEIIRNSMPWPREFEKDSYLSPDFTALDIIAFGGGSVPAGINIPNYDEIRQNEGFKNVHLQNIVAAYQSTANSMFVSESDAELLKKYRELSFEVQVGLHELLGHGSGKLFQQTSDDKFNFDVNTINPLTGKPVTSHYAPGLSYDLVFGAMSSTYEECRAEAIGYYLSLDLEIVKIFKQAEESELRDITYVNWLTFVLAGLRALQVYNPETGKWGQAHSQANHVILRVLLESAPKLVTIQETTDSEKKPDLLVTLNRDELWTSGKKALEDFLLKLQVYKSTADIEAAKKMYHDYSEVKPDSELSRWREIVIAKKKPRPILVQYNTRLNKDTNEVELLSYEGSSEGYAQSWIDRYDHPEPIYKALRALYEKDLEHFPCKNGIN